MMNSLIPYLLKVSLLFGILYFIYKLIYHKSLWHTLNRYILLFIIAFSVICPVLKIAAIFNYTIKNTSLWLDDFSEAFIKIPEMNFEEVEVNEYFTLNPFILIYIVGFMFFTFRFSWQFYKLLQIRKNSIVNKQGRFLIIRVKNKISPHSFFNWIFLPETFCDDTRLNVVIQHEKVHSRKLHSLDLILVELFGIVLWFNPIVILLKKSLKAVHEFQVDKEMVNSKIKIDDYLKILLESAEKFSFSGVVNNFKSSTLKNRIIMISKNKISGIFKIGYILFIPVIVFLFLSFTSDSDVNIKMSSSIERLFPPSGSNTSFSMFSSFVSSDTIPNIWPISSENIDKISSEYGMRIHPINKLKKMHLGIDIAAKKGVPVLATAAGKILLVEFKEEGKGYGRHVLIQHCKTLSTHYTQLSKFNVKRGDYVNKGDVIGYIGSSGISTGPHIHYEVVKNGAKVNPRDYLPQ